MNKQNAIQEYLVSDNARLLTSILKTEFSKLRLSTVDIKRIAWNGDAPVQYMRQVVNACKLAAERYELETGGICKGELKIVGSALIDIPARKFDVNILDRHTYKTEGTVLRHELMKDHLQYELFSHMISCFEDPRKARYKSITSTNNLTWFRDKKKALNYVKDTLSIPDPINKHPEKDTGNLITRMKDNSVILIEPDDKEAITTKDEFLDKYYLNSNSYAKDSPITESEIERTMNHDGIYDDADIKLLYRTIIRNAAFADTFKVRGSEYFNIDKLRKLADFYHDASSQEREQFWNDAGRIFKIKQM